MLWLALRAVCIAAAVLMMAAAANGDTYNIKFNQIEGLVGDQSPGRQIIDWQYRRVLSERDASLQWSNPWIAYDREDVDIAEEYQITLSKEFEMPWAYLKRKSGWSDQVRAAEMFRDDGLRFHLAELKSGYVSVRVHQQYLVRLRQLRNILTDASSVASSRHTEGHLSGVEEHLIQMVVISLNASYQDAVQYHREKLARWRASMGYATGDSVLLATEVAYLALDLQSIDHYAALASSMPGVQAREALQTGLSKRAGAARAAIIPSIALYGGYKKIEPEYDGYVAGVALSLPLFNRNAAQSRRLEAESNIARHEHQLYLQQVTGKVRALVESISDSQEMLATVADHFEEDLEALNSLLYSYEEGWMTLSELLNAIQIETSGLKDYYDQLTKYYENLFELEAMTGEWLVSF